ncbi:MAG: hypothetical protein QOG94_449 [Solirubrobacteraceae bacterium]|nr:hypothetical protein [Solirubrobacteraceae bacterium]
MGFREIARQLLLRYLIVRDAESCGIAGQIGNHTGEDNPAG